MRELESEKKSGSPAIKILVGCGVLVVLLVIAAVAWVYMSVDFTTDPAEVRSAASELVNGAEIPARFDGGTSVQAFGTRLTTLEDAESEITIMISQLPPGADLQQISAQSGQTGETTWQGVEMRTISVAGQDVEFECSLVTGDNVELRTWVGTISTGDQEWTTLMFQGPPDGFDEAAMMAFLNAIPPSPD